MSQKPIPGAARGLTAYRPRTPRPRPMPTHGAAGGGPAAEPRARAARADPVRLVIPADPDFLILVRSTAAHLGARIGLSVAEIDDFRLAVDEACGLLLTPGLRTGEALACEFCAFGDAVSLAVSATVAGDISREHVGTFGWSLLQALVDELSWSADAGRARVRLLKRRRGADSSRSSELRGSRS